MKNRNHSGQASQKHHAKIAWLFFLLPLLFCTACTMDFLPDQMQRVKLRGEIKTITIPLTDAPDDGIQLAVSLRFDDGGDNPIITRPPEKGESPAAVITYPSDMESYGFYADFDDTGTLKIGTEKQCQFDTEKFRVIITADVRSYDLRGGIELHADAGGQSVMPALSLRIAGGADCDINNIKADSVSVLIDGAADLSLSGKTDSLVGTVNGAADMDCSYLHADSVSLTINGAGAAAVYAESALDVEINGAGSVVYQGNPAITKAIHGAGSVRAQQPDED